MSKYIDAEKLIAEIKRYKNKADERLKIKGRTFSEEQKDLALQNLCGNLLHFITSLQQEQPEVDLVAELKHHLSTTPKEQLEKEWKELEPWNNVGPTVQEFLYGKPLEVCEPEYGPYARKYPKLEVSQEHPQVADASKMERLNVDALRDWSMRYAPGFREMIEDTAYHFWNLAISARKEHPKSLVDTNKTLDGLMEDVRRYYSENFAYITSDQPTLSILTNVARHFFELGLNSRKNE